MVEIVFTETQRARAMAEANRRQAVNEKSGLLYSPMSYQSEALLIFPVRLT